MIRILVILLLLIAPAAAQVAPAAAPKTTSGQYRAWAAFSYEENGAPTCYAAARPTERTTNPKGGMKTGKDKAYAYITHRPSERSLNVFNYDPGFELLLGSTVTLQIDGDKFTLFSADTGAWARGSDADRAIVNGLRKGKRLTITSTAQDKTQVTDTFSLSGSGLALDAIAKMCGL